MGFDDVACGVKVYWSGGVNNLSNEFDVLLSHKNQIFIIECKMTKKLNEEELVYKYEALKRFIAPQTRAMILHLSTNKGVESVSKRVQDRIAFNGIGFYSVQKIEQDDFKNFVSNLFLLPHPSDMYWSDSQLATAKPFIVTKKNDLDVADFELEQTIKIDTQITLATIKMEFANSTNKCNSKTNQR